MAQLLAIENDENELRKLLESYIQSGNLNFLIGSGASSPAISIAGTIEQEINQLIEKEKIDDANRKCASLINGLNEAHQQLLDNSETIQEVLESYTTFVSTIDRILFARKNLLLPRQANIFTTNYDLFVEHASQKVPGLNLNDGFDRSASLQNDFSFAPERYFDRTFRSGGGFGTPTEIPTINLIKLHGSMSWRKATDRVIFEATPTKPLSASDLKNPEKVSGFLNQYFLILPNLKKFHSTLMERTYYDLLRLYSKALDQQNVVLFSFGFSFSDEHILDITKRALRNPTLHLVIFAYDEAASEAYLTRFAQQRNVTVIVYDEEKLDFKKLNSLMSAVLSGAVNAAA